MSDDVLAAELALGLLDDRSRLAAEDRLATDRAFAAEHRWWTQRLADLFGDGSELPPPSLWGRIAARAAANDDAAAPTASRAAVGWRAAALAAGALAAMLGAGLAVALSRPPRVVVAVRPVEPPRLVAVLTGETAGAVTVAISYDPVSGRLKIAPAGLDRGEGSLELWAISADKKPRPLGLVPAARAVLIAPAASRTLVRSDTVLAISREPSGGSPTGAPTGPVILKGAMAWL